MRSAWICRSVSLAARPPSTFSTVGAGSSVAPVMWSRISRTRKATPSSAARAICAGPVAPLRPPSAARRRRIAVRRAQALQGRQEGDAAGVRRPRPPAPRTGRGRPAAGRARTQSTAEPAENTMPSRQNRVSPATWETTNGGVDSAGEDEAAAGAGVEGGRGAVGDLDRAGRLGAVADQGALLVGDDRRRSGPAAPKARPAWWSRSRPRCRPGAEGSPRPGPAGRSGRGSSPCVARSR